MRYETLSEACHAWVESFNAIPVSVVEKLKEYSEYCDIIEITPPAKYDYVYITGGEYRGESGEIIKTNDEEERYYVRLNQDKTVWVDKDDLDVERYEALPMHGTMWAFDDMIDRDWLSEEFCEGSLQAMADCGFRIYKSEDYGYIFGIDGAGYNFYEAHWYPLYKARGLHWHDVDDTVKEAV